MRLLLPVALVLGLALAGCGGGGSKSNGVAEKSADAIVGDALAAVDTAKTVHVAGAGQTGGTPLQLDLRLVAHEGGEGRVTTNGVSVQLVKIGPKAYFKGDADFWRSFGAGFAATLLQGRWLAAPTTNKNFAPLAPLTDISKLFHELVGGHGKLEKGDTTTIRGQPAIGIVDTDQHATLYVATTGKPYPLEARSAKKGKLTFGEWDDPVDLTAPENAIDLTKLLG